MISPRFLLAGLDAPDPSYEISDAALFPSGSYLSRVFGTPTDNNVFTYSTWLKRSGNGVQERILGSYVGGTDYFRFGFESDKLVVLDYLGAIIINLTSDGEYSDTSAWYHIVLTIDTNQAVSTDRVKMSVNGKEIGLTGTYPNQGAAIRFNLSGRQHQLFAFASSSTMNGYAAVSAFVDGDALPAATFGAFNDNGVWWPIPLEGISWGSNGSLCLYDNGLDLGEDSSGNINDWTVVGAVTQVHDTCINNICTWNNFDNRQDTAWPAFSNGNKDAGVTGTNINGSASVRANFTVTEGVWYWEHHVSSAPSQNYGMCGVDAPNTKRGTTDFGTGHAPSSWAYYAIDGTKRNNNVGTAYGATWGVGDTIGIKLDMNLRTLEFFKNNISQGVAFTDLPGVLCPSMSIYIDAASSQYTYLTDEHFANDDLTYVPPAGAQTLESKNLPTPSILNPAKHFHTQIRSGTGIEEVISGMLFSPGFAWIKDRFNAASNVLQDKITGIGLALFSDALNAADLVNDAIVSFNADGFTIDAGTTLSKGTVNNNGRSYIDWLWELNPSAGIDIINYTGTLILRDVPHNLNRVPALIAVKSQDASRNWFTYAEVADAGSGPENTIMVLEGNSAMFADNNMWAGTPPTDQVFTVSTDAGSNANGEEFTALLLANVPGMINITKYVANGLVDGTIVHCGFEVEALIIKSLTTAQSWFRFDRKRLGYDPANRYGYADTDSIEGTALLIDFTSYGFRIISSASGVNQSEQSYMVVAMAKSAFKNARAV